MTRDGRSGSLTGAIRGNPLQAGKFVGILLSLVLGVGGFFRIIDASVIVDDPILGDGQFLALVLIPLVSLGLVVVVFVETLVTGVRLLRSDESIGEQASGRAGYMLVRGVEAAIAIVGLTIVFTALPPLFADSTPAPAGVGIMLLLVVVGIGILFASLVRSAVELFVYGGTT